MVNKTVELVSQWAVYEAKHPNGTIEEFCRYYLTSNRKTKDTENLFNGEIPPRPDIMLMKLIDRIARLHMIYIHIALKDLKISHFEEFSLLSAIANLNNPRKTEVIYHTINELSTGLNLLVGLKKHGYIIERDDPEDKRSKRLNLTPKGERLLKSCYQKFSSIPEIMCMEMTKDDIEICIQILKIMEIKFSKLYLQHKDKSFEEVYKALTKL